MAFVQLTAVAQTISDIPNLTIWLRADTGLVFNGAEIDQWSDISGNNNHFVSVLSTTRPAFVANSALNGTPYLFFNGTKRMQSVNNLSFANSTVIVVAENNTGDPTFGRTIDHRYDFGFWIGRGSTTNVGGGFYEPDPPYGNFIAMPLDQPYVISMLRQGATVSSYSGSVPFTSPTRTTYGSATLSNKIMLGASLLGGDNGNKDIYEVIIFNRELSLSELSTVHNYLSSRYASSVALGPDVVIDDNLCPATLNTGPGFNAFLWSTGETTASINANQSGTYWVRATNNLGFYSYDTINVTLPVIPPPINTAICVNESNTWNADMGPGFTYLWSTGATTPSLAITTPGTYSVIVTGPGGCSRNSGDYTFSIDNYENTAFLGNDTTLCSGNLIALQIGASETVTYDWNGTSTPTQPSFWEVDTTGNYFWKALI
jgi:hypothetical protein